MKILIIEDEHELLATMKNYLESEGIINIRLNKSKLEISNSGDSFFVPSSKLFERFFKINASSESPGLGLSIVKEICTLNKWKIDYLYADDQHKFIIGF